MARYNYSGSIMSGRYWPIPVVCLIPINVAFGEAGLVVHLRTWPTMSTQGYRDSLHLEWAVKKVG